MSQCLPVSLVTVVHEEEVEPLSGLCDTVSAGQIIVCVCVCLHNNGIGIKEGQRVAVYVITSTVHRTAVIYIRIMQADLLSVLLFIIRAAVL